MNRAERERRHHANLERIHQLQQVCGRGDRARIDHEATLLERARLLAQELDAHDATERGLAALDRLLRLVEEGAGPTPDILALLAAVRDHLPLPLACLRGLPPSVGDDMLAVLDAYRHASLSLPESVEGGAQRMARALARAGLVASGRQ